MYTPKIENTDTNKQKCSEIFIAAVFTIGKTQKLCKCPSMGKRINKMR